MKLTNKTIPQARDYQCDKCKSIKCYKDMYDDSWCYDCYDETQKLLLLLNIKGEITY